MRGVLAFHQTILYDVLRILWFSRYIIYVVVILFTLTGVIYLTSMGVNVVTSMFSYLLQAFMMALLFLINSFSYMFHLILIIIHNLLYIVNYAGITSTTSSDLCRPPVIDILGRITDDNSLFCRMYNTANNIDPTPSVGLMFLKTYWLYALIAIVIILIVTIFTILIFTYRTVFYSIHTVNDTVRHVISQKLDAAAERQQNYDTMRNVFRNFKIPVKKPTGSHSHPNAAIRRSEASEACVQFARYLGYIPYYYQMSTTDQRRGFEGSRNYHWTKDLTGSYRYDNITSSHMIIMIDVDYYVDMNYFLSGNEQPIILYTFCPHTASGTGANYSYSFINNICKYRVNGGGEYTHSVWNYNKDTIKVTRYYLGIPIKVATYAIERRIAHEDHEIVLLVPLLRWNNVISSIYATLTLYDESLTTLAPNAKGFTKFRYQSDKPTISLAIEGTSASVTLPENIFESIMVRGRQQKTAMTASSVALMMKSLGLVDTQGCEIIAQYIRDVLQEEETVENLSIVPRAYHYDTNVTIIEENTQSMKSFMNPIVPPAYVPELSVNNDISMVYGRVIKVRQTEMPNQKQLDIAMAFAQCMVPDEIMGILVPADLDYVREKQSRPSQTQLYEATAAMPLPVKAETSTFMKKECYSEPKDPRNISTFKGQVRTELSRYALALAKWVKENCKWYTFGRTPKEIADLVVELCAESDHLLGSDGSRWDGHFSQLLHMVKHYVFIRIFAKEYHPEMIMCLDSVKDAKAYSAFMVMFLTKLSVTSGNAITSIMNSIGNKFISFYTAVVHEGMTYEEAYELPGIYAGDDGLTANLNLENLILGAKECGQEYKGEIFKQGMTVEFLARRYPPAVWHGDPNSTCQLMRTLTQLPYTVNNNFTPEEKFVIKMRAYALTDRNTLILSSLIDTTERILGEEFDLETKSHVDGISGWWSIYPYNVQWPNDVTNLADDHYFVPNEGGSSLEHFNHNQFQEDLSKCKTITDLLNLKCYVAHEIVVKPNVAINGEVSSVDPSKIIASIVDQTGAVHIEENTIDPNTQKMQAIKECLLNLKYEIGPLSIYDIGCGNQQIGRYLAVTLGASRYIAIDKEFDDPKIIELRCAYSLEGIEYIPVTPDIVFKDKTVLGEHMKHDHINIVVLSMSFHHMQESDYSKVISSLQYTPVGTYIYIYEHDAMNKSFNHQLMADVHKRYNDNSPTYYRGRNALLGKLMAKKGQKKCMDFLFRWNSKDLVDTQCKWAVTLQRIAVNVESGSSDSSFEETEVIPKSVVPKAQHPTPPVLNNSVKKQLMAELGKGKSTNKKFAKTLPLKATAKTSNNVRRPKSSPNVVKK